MESYSEIPAIWDLTSPDSAHPGEQEFFDLLQKQYAPVQTNGSISAFPTFMDAVNPQNLSLFSLSNLTPSSASDDSNSPSPPTHQDAPQDGNADDPSLKRKASTNKLESEPNNKTQHTASTDKRGATVTPSGARRKSSGQNSRDEQRLLKRKEQNRAAQRAFRERKEKHVKDLEDKVAELEAKNEAAQHENENLRDMLSRLQSENMTLKQSTFTFSMPKDSTSMDSTLPPNPAISPAQSISSSSSTTLPASPKLTNPLDWSSLNTFDPNVLNLLDGNISQSTATDNAMRMDFGLGNADLTSNSPITIIANNPMFTTPAFDFSTPGELNSMIGTGSPFNNGSASASSNSNPFNFDMNSLTSWPQSNASVSDPIFDDLFRGYLSSLTSPDFMSFTASTPSISPITHPSPSQTSAPSSSPSILTQEPLFTMATSASTTDADSSVAHSPGTCQNPKSKEECREKIAQEGNSMFAPPIQKNQDQLLGTMVKCVGSSLPKTAKNDLNIEVLTAWKNIRSDPKFKDVDMNELCHQFTQKACCDGTQVVLEPAAVNEIMDNLSKSRGH